MLRRAIRNLASNKPVPPRLFDVVIEEDHPDQVYIEQKLDNKRTERVPWEDVKYQVESAIRQIKPVE